LRLHSVQTESDPGYAGFCAGSAWATPKVTPLLHEGRTLSPCLGYSLITPESHPGYTR